MRKFRFITAAVLIICFSVCWLAGAFGVSEITAFSASSDNVDADGVALAQSDLWDDIANLLWPKEKSKNLGKVVLGGIPVGIALEDKGVQIVGFSEINTGDAKICPAAEGGLKAGDRIITINGVRVTSVAELSSYAEKSNGSALKIEFLRNSKTEFTEITPVKDILTKNFRLGILAKEACNGVGTLTFLRQDLTFGCLGHPMTSSDTHEIIEIDGGNVFNCRILDVKKGAKGAAGELKGVFTGKQAIGKINKNNKFGVYGEYSSVPKNISMDKLVPVACVAEVKPGKAQIISTVDGEIPKYYDIEIVKVVNQTEKDDRGLVIHVTDKELLNFTGGIVQGMSGSPIVQGGKLVGAVTHVFINDPTRGYGVFAEWMLSE